MKRYKLANPNPEFLIKSIAEQGYSLETSLADLVDNSITANAKKVEILTRTDKEPFMLFVADDGNGMDKESLEKNMQFPSQSPEDERGKEDLGRFGLGLKTASFSQTRCFTVISRKIGETDYNGLTWDVAYLKQEGQWRIIVNSPDEIKDLLKIYENESRCRLNSFSDFKPNTIIIWRGLYKYEEYSNVDNNKNALAEDLTNKTNEYLSIVFHRFLERDNHPFKIRINNIFVYPFNPFPGKLRPLDPVQNFFNNESVKIQGFVLPNSSIKEAKNAGNQWTTKGKSLMDMEGIYVYRADRLIISGGWNGMMKKMPRLQLARLKVEIGNKTDKYFHLNVSKSKISTPFELKSAFLKTLAVLKTEAQKEYYNFGTNTIPRNQSSNNTSIFFRVATNKGVLLEINQNFTLLKSLKSSLNDEQLAELNCILKLFVNQINKSRNQEVIEIMGDPTVDGVSYQEVATVIRKMLEDGLSIEEIKAGFFTGLGMKEDSLPEEIMYLIKKQGNEKQS